MLLANPGDVDGGAVPIPRETLRHLRKTVPDPGIGLEEKDLQRRVPGGAHPPDECELSQKA
jgi:hypothetical protein